ncbi:hypothetical protein GCM10010245_00130 [Streptomyces spectabilis]|nr:hypothetical protein GCM10010245_00130 [Streptomyces spectabilis]
MSSGGGNGIQCEAATLAMLLAAARADTKPGARIRVNRVTAPAQSETVLDRQANRLFTVELTSADYAVATFTGYESLRQAEGARPLWRPVEGRRRGWSHESCRLRSAQLTHCN